MAMFERALRLDWCAYRVTTLVANADLSFRRTCGDGKKANAGENRRYASEKEVVVVTGFILGSTYLLWLIDSHHTLVVCMENGGDQKDRGKIVMCPLVPAP